MPLFWKTERTEEPAPAGSGQELTELRASLEKARLPEPAAGVADREMEKLEKTDASIPEYSIGLSYIELLISLPWRHYTEDNLDLGRAERLLEAQHYGLKHVKDRVLEYLAVRALCGIKDFQILVVDDEEIARTNVEYVLKKEGYQVSTAANGIEALERLRTSEFDLILTDLKMEKMDGLQLLESVRQQAPFTEVVMITGFATVSTAVDALKKGAAHYLPKPVDLEELRMTVHRIREKKRHMTMTRSPVLCFSGPPGTGKTSIGRSIAEALERRFVRISLAGLRDEADLRGHRRTYVGAMAGRIINEMRRLGVKNPVFMLDEIDKIGQDFRGDPASVLLEILDPEQNSRFIDHYLDVPFDLSSVMFIATANAIERLPDALRDRLEVIPFPGYTEREKQRIAFDYLIPRQLRDHGLLRNRVTFSPGAVSRVVRDYTLEAGLRNLDREIANICRKLARFTLQEPESANHIMVDDGLVEKLLGPRKYTHELAGAGHRTGVTTGLVWTELGGEIISVEATIMPGCQQLILTGSLGSVLQESAQTALSHIRSRAVEYAVEPEFFKNRDIHIHIPAGAIPKDGSSAGVTIAMALMSLLTRRPARRDVALTGELTLSGLVLPVSGVREKVLAAQRAGVKTVVLPAGNQLDADQLEPEATEGIDVVLVDELEAAIDVALVRPGSA